MSRFLHPAVGIILFSLLSSPASAQAAGAPTPPSRQIVKSTLDRLFYARMKGAALCPTVVDAEIREYFFVFDGGGDYAPAKAILEIPDLHTGEVLGKTLFEQATFPFVAVDGQTLPIYPPEWTRDRIDFHRMVMPIHRADGRGSMLSAIKQVAGAAVGQGRRMLYYDFYEPKTAAACAQRLHDLYRQAGLPLTFSASGFSLGGYATVRFARELDRRDLRLREVLTFDPVPYTLEFYKSLRLQENTTRIVLPSNFERWNNLYQTKDIDTLNDRIPIRGARLAGATNALAVDSTKTEVDDHLDVPECNNALNFLREILHRPASGLQK